MKNLFLSFLEFLSYSICSFIILIFWINFNLPKLDSVKYLLRSNYIKIYDENNKLIAKYGNYEDKKTDPKNLPIYCIYALLDIEDKKFFKHNGFDSLALLRSIFLIIKSKKIYGGSTITQQLAKNILQNQSKVSIFDRSIIRKIKEAVLTYRLEKNYTKDEILSFYINRIYFGSGCYGLNSASLHYFDKKAEDLNIHEAALLMGLIQSPSKFSANQNSWKKRGLQVLRNMHKNKHIDLSSVEAFKNFQFPQKKMHENHIRYFTDYVVEQIPKHLRYKDLEIKTTLNMEMQENAYQSILKAFQEAGKEWNADQGSMIIIKKNGEIKAIIGGKDYNKSQFNRAIHSFRPSGSTSKYFVYLEAMIQKIDPESEVDDSPFELGEWKPSNYLHKTQGKVNLLYAFAQSVNSVSIRLLQACSIKKVIALTRKLKIKSTINHNLTFPLGGFNTTLIDLTQAFIPILNQGSHIEKYCIKEIKDLETNEILFQHHSQYEKLFEELAIYNMWRLLKHTTSPIGSGRKLNANGSIIGGKSGTSNNYKDLYFILLTTEYIIGTWFGRDDYGPMNYQPGKSLPIIALNHLLKTFPTKKNDLKFNLDIDEKNDLTIMDLYI